MVPGAGVEPARSFLRGILSPLCLPIPPPGLTTRHKKQNWFKNEAGVGIEPALTDLQSAALPLCHPAEVSIVKLNKFREYIFILIYFFSTSLCMLRSLHIFSKALISLTRFSCSFVFILRNSMVKRDFCSIPLGVKKY